MLDRARAGVALGSLVVGCLLLPAPASAAYPGTNGLIAFSRFVGDGFDIFAIAPDGSGESQLTSDGDLDLADDTEPSWSPDGTRIAFQTLRSGNGGSEIYLMNADGSGQTNLTNSSDASEWDPTWSPDGARVAFTRCCLDGDAETT